MWKFDGVTRLDDAKSLTLYEYFQLRRAAEKKEVEHDYNLRRLAWYTEREVGATKNVGSEKKPKEKLIFPTFDEWFDYADALKTVELGYSPKQRKQKKQKTTVQDVYRKLEAAKRKDGD